MKNQNSPITYNFQEIDTWKSLSAGQIKKAKKFGCVKVKWSSWAGTPTTLIDELGFEVFLLKNNRLMSLISF